MSGQPTPTQSNLTLEEFKALYAAEIERQKRVQHDERYRAVPPLARLWLALVPFWTVELARATSMPLDGRDAADVFAQLRTADVLVDNSTARTPQAARTDAICLIASGPRTEILDDHSGSAAGVATLRRTAADVGSRILGVRANGDGAGVPLPTLRWAMLAVRADTTEALVAEFEAHANHAFDAHAASEVLNWMDAARPISAILIRDAEPAMEMALQRASRQLELLHRRTYDEQQLDYFLERPDQVAAFNRLMTGAEDEPWALHYMGVGGVGKTMLVRHIAVNLAERYGAATARIDFDYLNADYPRLAPGLLLWSFAQELRAYDQTRNARVNSLLDGADRLLDQLHQRLRTDRRLVTSKPATDDPHFRSALDLYIQAFRLLGRRLVLIIDTCEELAKVTPAGTVPPNVEETFRILRGLRFGAGALDEDDGESGSVDRSQGLPDLRVVFSGRRPLARRGFGWAYPSAAELPERPYLRLHHIAAFTLDEAHRFLTSIKRIPPDLVEPILQQTAQRGDVAVNRIQEDTPGAAGGDTQPSVLRCNPYDLRLFAEWATDVPPPGPSDILGATSDRYVDLRIIRRLGSGILENALPCVALVGHLDTDLLAAVLHLDDVSASRLFDELGRQEWIAQRYVSVGGEYSHLMLDVDPTIRRQLAEHYARHRSAVEQLRPGAADYLERLTLERDLSVLDWSLIDAALHVLQLDPDSERAERWWQSMEERLLQQRDFQWVLDLTGKLLADGAAAEQGASGRTPSRLRPRVASTYASALLHVAPARRAELAGIWDEVHSARVGAEHDTQLTMRALAGKVAAKAAGPYGPELAEVEVFWSEVARLDTTLEQNRPSVLDDEVAAAFVAAAEAVVEYVEGIGRAEPRARRMLETPLLPGQDSTVSSPPMRAVGPVVLAHLLVQLEQRRPGPALGYLVAFAQSLAARALYFLGHSFDVFDWFGRSLQFATTAADTGQPVVFADWVPPEDLAARLQLEFLRIAYPAFASPATVLDLLGRPPLTAPPSSVDADRLSSALLRLRLAEGVVAPEVLEPLGWLEAEGRSMKFRETDITPGRPTCNAHRTIPPLFATAAEVVAACGFVDSALVQLRHVVAQVEQFDLDSVREADRALARIVRWMRLRDIGEVAGISLLDSSEVEDRVLVLALDGLDGDKCPERLSSLSPLPLEDRAAWLHAVWRTRFARSGPRAEHIIKWAVENLPKPSLSAGGAALDGTDFNKASLILDLLELELLRDRVGLQPAQVRPPSSGARWWWADHPTEPLEALRVWLRCIALLPGTELMLDELVARIGARRAAQIAFEEGELLALRLPDQAAALIGHAARLFKSAHDDVSTIIAGGELALLRGRPPADVRRLDSAIATVRAAYRRLMSASPTAAQARGLPDWSALKALAPRPEAWQVSALGPYGWRPWLVRLAAALARLEIARGATQPSQEPAMRSAITFAFGTSIGTAVALPAAFHGWFPETGPRPTSKVRQRARKATRVIVNIGLLTGGIAGILTAIILVANLLANEVRGLSDGVNALEQSSVMRAVAPLVLAVVMIAFSWWEGKRIWAWLWGGRRVHRRRRAFKWTGRVAGLLVSSTVAFVVLAILAVSVSNWTRDPVLSGTGAWMAGFLVLLLLGLLPTALVELILFVNAYRMSTSTLLIQIISACPPPGETATVPDDSIFVRLQRRMPSIDLALWPPFGRRIVWQASLPAKLPDAAGGYRELVFPYKIAAELGRVERTLSANSLPLELEVDDDAHGPCWEAAIARERPTAFPNPVEASLRVYRTALRRVDPGPALPRDEHDLHVAVWTESQIAAEIAQRVWSTPFRAYVTRTSQVGWVDHEVGPVHVVHLVGTAIQTSAGFRFRLAQDVAVETAVVSARRSALAQGTLDEATSPATLVRPSDVPRIFPSLGVCIIQGEPDRLSAARLESDRRDAAAARFFAARLFRQGVRAVLVIPPLPASLAHMVPAEVAHILAEEPIWGVATLQRALLRAQIAIASAGSDAPEDKARVSELALDACIYVSD